LVLTRVKGFLVLMTISRARPIVKHGSGTN
jgi:hypothetical protein